MLSHRHIGPADSRRQWSAQVGPMVVQSDYQKADSAYEPLASNEFNRVCEKEGDRSQVLPARMQ